MADLNVKVGLDRSGFQTGLAAMENDAAKFGQKISSIKPGNISGAFKSIASDLASAKSPAEALSSVMGNLSNLLRGTAFGAAGLAIGKVLSAPFEQLSGLVQSSAESAKKALDSISSSGPATSLAEATAQANALNSAIGDIQSSIQQIDSNPFLRLADSFVGARNELQELEKSLQRVMASQLSEATFNEANLAESLVGKNADERARMKIKADAEKEKQRIRAEFAGTGLNADTAIADVDRKQAAQLRELDLKKQENDAKALEELISGFKKAEREKNRRLDDEEHADAIKRANEILAKIEEQNKLRQENASAALKIEDIRAERAGPQAEEDLLRKRAQEAIGVANRTQSAQDILAAEEARRDFEKAVQRRFQSAGLDQGPAMGLAQSAGEQLGIIPQLAASLRDIAKQPMVVNANPDGAKDGTVDEVRARVQECVDRLDQIIRLSGTFSI